MSGAPFAALAVFGGRISLFYNMHAEEESNKLFTTIDLHRAKSGFYCRCAGNL